MRVTIDSGPVTATMKLKEVPRDQWHDLMQKRRSFFRNQASL